MHSDADPSEWVTRFAACIPPGRVLDVACGAGRHARWMSDAGHDVLAVDRDAALLDGLRRCGIATTCIDLESDGAAVRQLFVPRGFSGIVVTRYLHLPLLPLMFASLSEGGVLIYETFASGNAAFGKPSNPDFLLRPGELLAAAADACCTMHVLAYEDGIVRSPTPARMQRLCALRSEGTLPPKLML